MKLARWVFKIAALTMVVAALACGIVAYWDKIEEYAYRMRQRLAARKCCSDSDADYEDWVD